MNPYLRPYNDRIIYVEDDDGNIREIDIESLPHEMEVCPSCRGKGHHVNRAIDGNGITAEEMWELGDEFMEDYRSGLYDVTCEECRGRNVIPVIDWDRVDPAIRDAWEEQVQSHYDDAHTRWAEDGYPQ